jgi:hypothetical protein
MGNKNNMNASAAVMTSSAVTLDPREGQPLPFDPSPRFWPDELRSKPQLSVHQAEADWARGIPANPHRALAEIAEKAFTKSDHAAIQKLEDEIGMVDSDRKEHCDASRLDQALWDLNQDAELPTEELIARTEAIEKERAAIPQWRAALDRQEADLKERLRPFALKLAIELPGRVAKSINELEKVAGPDGSMAYWGIAQNFDQGLIVNPLRRLHSLALSWVQSLQTNDADAKESRIRAILADSGVLKPRVHVYRAQY